MAQKKKADCTPEEWADIRAKDLAYQVQYRAQKEKREKIQKRESARRATPVYREWDNARYGDHRRAQALLNSRKRRFGVTQKQIDDLMILQGGRCAICRRLFEDLQKPDAKRTVQCFDHCHETGKHRGLLCLMCNTVEGFIKKLNLTPAEYAERMQAYLDNPPAQEEVLW